MGTEVIHNFLLVFNLLVLLLQYGISGPYWYAAGATIQIIIFSILSIMLKTRAPGAKTFLQVRLVFTTFYKSKRLSLIHI